MKRFGVVFNLEPAGPVFWAFFTSDESADHFLRAMAATDGGPPPYKHVHQGWREDLDIPRFGANE